MKRKNVAFLIILFIVYALQFFNIKTQLFQQLLIVESNGLFTTNHVVLDSQDLDNWKSNRTKFNDIHAYSLVEKSMDKTVMALYANDFNSTYLPIGEGFMFDDYEYNQVLVGRNINTFKEDGIEYYQYDNKNYRVVGKLGITDNSPLENYVLLNNLTYFDNPSYEIILSGAGINKLNLNIVNNTDNKGVDRWLNISAYTSFIKYISYLVIIMSVGLSGFYFVIGTKDKRFLKYQIGIPPQKILLQDIRFLTIVVGILSLLSLLIHQRGLYRPDITMLIKNYAVIYITLITTYMVMTRKQLEWRSL